MLSVRMIVCLQQKLLNIFLEGCVQPRVVQEKRTVEAETEMTKRDPEIKAK